MDVKEYLAAYNRISIYEGFIGTLTLYIGRKIKVHDVECVSIRTRDDARREIIRWNNKIDDLDIHRTELLKTHPDLPDVLHFKVPWISLK